MTKTWLITGSSRGFGWEIAKAVLERATKIIIDTMDRVESVGRLRHLVEERVTRVVLLAA